VIAADGGLLAYRELHGVLALTTSGGERLAEARTGKKQTPPFGRIAAAVGMAVSRAKHQGIPPGSGGRGIA
jgi:hypothetical protein